MRLAFNMATTPILTGIPGSSDKRPSTTTTSLASPASEIRDDDLLPMPEFDPAIHLAFEPPTKRHRFSEYGLLKPDSCPDICFTEPFPLFSEEGVRLLRRELLQKKVLDKHLWSWDRAPCYIGAIEPTARWINNVWKHPAVTECLSKAFGLPLEVLGRRGEVAHVNVQLGPEGVEGIYQLKEQPSAAYPRLPEGYATSKNTDNDVPRFIDSWHRDSTQVASVLMLSDTSTMIGGETAIDLGDGRIVKVRGARMGSAVMIQGCHLRHAAFPAQNAPERISMVTSYHFVDPDLDDSGTSLRSISPQHMNVPVIHDHFLLHKLVKLRQRIDVMIDRVKQTQGSGVMTARETVEPWVVEQMRFLKHTSWELCERYPEWLYKDVPEEVKQRYLAEV